MRRRIISVLLAATMVVGVTGCMKSGNAGGNAKDKKPQKAVEVPEGLWDPYEEEVTISTVLPENAGIQWDEGDSYDDNPWYRAYKEQFNIKVVNDWVSNDYSTKLNLSIADGSIPDVFFVNSQQLRELQEADLIWDLTEVYDKYASDLIKGYMEQESDTFETGKLNGKLYGIPQLSYGIIDQPSQIWIRKDWKEKLGLADPKTMDDVINIAKTFQKEYGGYGLTENQDLIGLKVLAPAWGAYPSIWVESENGELGYGSVQPEMKEALEAYSEWYKEGIVDPQFATKDLEKMLQGELNSEVGVSPYYQYWGYDPGPNMVSNNGKDSIFEAYKIPSANGETVKAPVSFANYGYIVVNKNCKNPEAVVKLLNFYARCMDEPDQVSKEMINDLFKNAYTNIPYALRVINPNTDYNQFVKVTDTLKVGLDEDPTALGKDGIKYKNSVDFIKNGASTGVGDYCQQGGPKAAYKISKEMIDNEEYIKDAMWGPATETLLSSGSTLDDILTEGFTKIIVGDKDIDYFDTLVEEWEKAGGAKATEEINEMYGNK
ncbi:MAG: extracellular solute-binding protein [Lachnospiraceae bacterium]|nr:extracellular solute-binding protein [Lachnospiraceae bacterium]